ncbi:MAG TPA: hypothetical protein VGC55_08410 [Dokdonella sp.]
MGFSLGGAISGAASWVGSKVEGAVEEGGEALKGAQQWVGDRLDDIDHAEAAVGSKIDGAVHDAEKAVDGFRHGLETFGQEHGGVVGGAIAKTVSDGIGMTEGAGLAVYDMGKGVVQLADGAGKLVNPLEWAAHGDKNLQRLETVGKTAEVLGNLTSPVAWATNTQGNLNTAKALWNGVTGGYQDAAKSGDWSKFIGRGVVDIGSFFIGAGEANAAIKGAEGTRVLGELGEGAKALDVADAAGGIAKGSEAAGDAGHIASGLGKAKAEEILALPKGARPNPTEYLSPAYISDHLAQFDDGASRFMTQSNLSKYGIGQRDGTSFVMPSREADQLLASAKGDPRALEQALGLPEHSLDNNALVRVDIPKPKELDLRIPSGNEAGANEQWIPGGKLPTGNSEAVIDVKGIPDTRYSTTPVR